MVDYIRYSRNDILKLKSISIKDSLENNCSSWLKYPLRPLRKRTGHHGGFQKAIKTIDAKNMTFPLMISLNARSILDKMDDLKSLLTEKLFHNVCAINIQETWLHSLVDDSLIDINGFTIFRQDRTSSTKKRGGGLLTFIRNSYCKYAKVWFSYNQNEIECLVLRCKRNHIPSCDYVFVINIYIAPDCPTAEVEAFFYVLTENLQDHIDSNLILMTGDFNHANVSQLSLLSLCNIVNFSTRNNSQLDLVFSDHPLHFAVKKHAPLSSSDHCILRIIPKIYSTTYRKTVSKNKTTVLRIRDTCTENLQLFQNMVQLQDLTFIHSIPLDDAVLQLTSLLCEMYDFYCPTIKYTVSENHKVSSTKLKKLRRAKELAYKSGNKESLKNLNVQIKSEIKNIYRCLNDQFFNSSNPRDIWAGINKVLGVTRKSLITTTNINELNCHFVKPVRFPLIEPTIDTRCETDTTQWAPVPSSAILKMIRESKSNSAPGPDKITNKILKACPSSAIEHIKAIVERSLHERQLPKQWKTSKITPVPKISHPYDDPSNFRPIACTSVMLKIAEKVVLNELRPFLVHSSDPLQFGYKRHRSTLDCLAFLIDHASQKLDEGHCIVRCTFLDYKAAFDTAPRSKIINHLTSIGVPKHIIEWLLDYFWQRQQYVESGSRVSSTITNNNGVPQGAILSPFLFNALIDSLRVDAPSIMIKYADDVALVETIKEPSDLNHLYESLNQIKTWSDEQGLDINTLKSHIIDFASKRPSKKLDQLREQTISLCGTNLEYKNVIKYLGVELTPTLQWTKHLEKVFIKIRRLCFFARKLRKCQVNPQYIRKYVEACIFPVLLYCSPVIYSNLLKKDIKLLKRCFNLLAKAINLPYDEVARLIITNHVADCSNLAKRILDDPSHPLHEKLNQARSSGRTRRPFIHLKAKTNVYLNSPLPYLVRFLSDPEGFKFKMAAVFAQI